MEIISLSTRDVNDVIRNNLVPILGYAGFLEESTNLTLEQREMVQNILQAGTALKDLADRLNNISWSL